MTTPLEELAILIQNHPDEIFNRIKQFVQLNPDSQAKIRSVIEFVQKGYIPILYANHQSHADGLIFSMIIDQIIHVVTPDELQGFFCPIAASMQTGDQHSNVQEAGSFFLPLFASKGLITLPVIRESDRQKYGMKGSNHEVLQKILKSPELQYGLAVFPEGTVQGGRKKKDGSVYGMQQAEQVALIIRCMSFWKDKGKESVLLPIGIEGTYKLFSPDKYDIRQDLVDMISGKTNVEKVTTVILGNPFTTQELQAVFKAPLNAKSPDQQTYLMKKIASLLPEELRGYYRNC